MFLAFGFPLYPDFGAAHRLPLTIRQRGSAIFAPEIFSQFIRSSLSALFFNGRFLQRRKHFGQLGENRIWFYGHAQILAGVDDSDKRDDSKVRL